MIPADILGFSRLGVDATAGMITVVEAMHRTIAGDLLAGMVGAAYAPVCGVTKLVGHGIEAVIAPFVEMSRNASFAGTGSDAGGCERDLG